MIKNQYNTNKMKKQALYKNYRNKFIEDPIRFFMLFNCTHPKAILILDEVLRLDNNYDNLYFSQEKLAEKLGISRTYVNQILKLAYEVGILINKKSQGIKHTCIYKFNSIMHDRFFRWSLRNVLPSLKWLPVKFLLSVNTIIKRYIYKQKLVSVQSLVSKNNAYSISSTCLREGEVKRRERNTNNYCGTDIDNKCIICYDVTSTTSKKFIGKTMEILEKIKQELSFGDYEIEKLQQFEPSILEKAYSNLKRKPEIDYQFAYLLKACRMITELNQYQKKEPKNNRKHLSNSPLYEAPINNPLYEKYGQRKQNPNHPPHPKISKSYEENLELFEKWYLEFGEQYAYDMNTTKPLLSRRFMEKLNDYFHDEKDPNKIERWRNKAKVFREILAKNNPEFTQQEEPNAFKNDQNPLMLIKTVVDIVMGHAKEKQSSNVKNDDNLNPFKNLDDTNLFDEIL